MKYRNPGRSGLRVSEISLGSWLTLGSSVDAAGTRELVRAAWDLGIQCFVPLPKLDPLDGLDRAGTARPQGGSYDQALAVSHRQAPLAAAA